VSAATPSGTSGTGGSGGPSGSGDGPRQAKRSLRSRLYHGETDFAIVRRRRTWFTISIVAVLIGLLSLATRGLHLGIDFEGGVVWEVPSEEVSVSEARDALGSVGLEDATIQTLESDEGRVLRVESEPLEAERSDRVTARLAEVTGTTVDDVNLTEVGPSWGQEISEKALRALIVFLVLVTLYIAVRFELKMAIPTLVALVHDILVTVGVYSLTQFEVTPATVVAILTILGFSIYDGIVVFDKVDENTRLVSSTGGLTYGGMVNLSLNQALMRSLNTSITAVLPVGSLLIIGSWVMGASPLEEFALALLVGLASGAYSSIFIASPLLALLKEREPRFRDIKRRIESRAGPVSGGRAAASAVSKRRVTARGRAAATGTGTGRGTGAGGAKVRKGKATTAASQAGARADAEPEPDEGGAEAGTEAEVEPAGTGGPSPVPSGGNGGRPVEPVIRTDRVIPPRPRKRSKGRRR
jgi:preprotein translocase subunit SecF